MGSVHKSALITLETFPDNGGGPNIRSAFAASVKIASSETYVWPAMYGDLSPDEDGYFDDLFNNRRF